jgi:hypothetical protein
LFDAAMSTDRNVVGKKKEIHLLATGLISYRGEAVTCIGSLQVPVPQCGDNFSSSCDFMNGDERVKNRQVKYNIHY